MKVEAAGSELKAGGIASRVRPEHGQKLLRRNCQLKPVQLTATVALGTVAAVGELNIVFAHATLEVSLLEFLRAYRGGLDDNHT